MQLSAVLAFDPLYALTNPKNLSVTVTTYRGTGDLSTIEQWELEAAQRALTNLETLAYGSANTAEIDSLNLIDARSQLLTLKANLYDELPQLLSGQIAEADQLMNQYVAESNGTWNQTQTTLHVTGMSSEEFLSGVSAFGLTDLVPGIPETLSSRQDNSITDALIKEISLEFLFPVHPEHYEIITSPIGVVETWNYIPTRTVIGIDFGDKPAFVTPYIDSGYLYYVGYASTLDGPIVTWVLQQFSDSDDGFDVDLRIWFPAACPFDYFSLHSEHYAIEFKNGILLIADLL